MQFADVLHRFVIILEKKQISNIFLCCLRFQFLIRSREYLYRSLRATDFASYRYHVLKSRIVLVLAVVKTFMVNIEL